METPNVSDRAGQVRLRRLRMSPALRNLVAETRLHPQELIYPVFIKEGLKEPTPVSSMPGVWVQSEESLAGHLEESMQAGVSAFLFFGIPSHKDGVASEAWAENGVVQRALRRARSTLGDAALLIADTCLCEYTSHGHCGPLCMVGQHVTVANDAACELLGRTAASQAEAGADIVAPSAMMDGQVAAIREALDGAGHASIAIMSYSAKFASAYYGPFRDAAESAPSEGDRRSYQMDPANARETLRESAQDVAEGADILMVKPAGPCLDIIAEHRRTFQHPIAAYQVSGEMAMIEAAAERGWIRREDVIRESLLAIRRAGASPIITYYAVEVANYLTHG
jgi:porphobilinogen synthase